VCVNGLKYRKRIPDYYDTMKAEYAVGAQSACRLYSKIYFFIIFKGER